MANLEIHISYFCWANNTKAKNYPLVYSIEPKGKFQKFGNLYLLANFDFSEPPSKKEKSIAENFAKKALTQMEDVYYDPLKSSKSLEANFENLLNQINNWLKREILRSNKPFLENAKLAIILSKDGQIYCSKFANFVIFLVSKDKFDLLGPKEQNDSKFNNLISGKLSENDTLFFVHEDIFSYFSQDKIAQLLRTNSPKEFQDIIIKRLKSLNLNLCGLIIQAKAEQKKERKEKETEKSASSNILKPPPSSGKIEHPQKKKKNWFSCLTYPQKAIFVLVIIFLILFVQNVIVSERNSRLREQKLLFDQFNAQFSLKKEELLSATVKTDTKTILKDMEDILANFPQKNKAQKQRYEALKQEWLSYIKKYYKYTPIDLKPVFNLADLEASFLPTNLVKNNKFYYVSNKANNHLWQIDLASKEASLLSTSLEESPKIQKLICLDKDNLLLVNERKETGRFNLKTKTFTPLKIDRLKENIEISEISLYGGKIYILDKKSHQIFRYPETIIGFSKGKPWILEQKPRNFTNISGFAIDGAIYLVKFDGTILKFYLGQQKEFPQKDIFPEIEKITLFYTHPETNYLYLIDKANRLIIYDKDGNLVGQYVNPALGKAKSIEEERGVITILSEAKIFQFSHTPK